MIKKLTRKQAIKLYDSGFWKTLTNKKIVMFQLFQPLLCIPFDVFHRALEKVLKRSISDIEINEADKLRKEFLGDKKPPTWNELIKLIPKKDYLF